MIKKLSQFIFLIQLLIAAKSQETTIKQVYVILGEASRSPLTVYPTDAYNETYWSRYGGLGQITPNGLLQSYNLGQFLKGYYTDFLTPEYKPANVYARSIDLDRCLQGLNSFLSGMFPPANSDQLWSPSVSWYPIPIHTNNPDSDNIFYRSCPKYDKLITDSLDSIKNSQLEFDQRFFIQSMTNQSGISPLNYYHLNKILDSNLAKQANKLPVKPWVSENLANLTRAYNNRLQIKYGTIEKAMYKSGSLLYNIISNIRDKMLGSTNEIFVYSTTNDYLVAMIQLLGLESQVKLLPFGSAIIIELHKDTNENYTVQVLLKTNKIDDPVKLEKVKINDCDMLCPIGEFRNATDDRVLTNHTEVCKLDEPTTTTPLTTTANTTTTVQLLTSYSPLKVECPTMNDTITDLEIGLIVATVFLGIITIVLVIMVGILIKRNKVMRTAF